MSWCDSSGVNIHYSMSGRGNRSLILIHELGGTSVSWDAVLPMVDAQFKTLRYDQRGAGLSEKVREPFTIDDHVSDLEAVVKHSGLPGPYYVAAVAAGAAIAIGFAHARPTQVRAAVLCAAATDVSEDRRSFLIERAELASTKGMRAVADATLARSYAPPVRNNPAIFEDYRARLLGNDPVCYGLANLALLNASLDAAIASLNFPCLLLAGAHDLLRPPADVKALAAMIPGSQFAIIDTGHVMPVQAPRALADKMLNFFSAATETQPAKTSAHNAPA